MGATYRMDMHCHSRASNKPVTPWLGVFDVPESYSPPEKVYEQARARGMDFVTLTDHDTIDGAMELVRRGFEGVVVGEEVTVHFPEDRCRLHVLLWGLTPEQHEEIDDLGLRDDVYHFADWLSTANLAHALAHPLYVQNGRLDATHLDRCVLLFRAWETLNGAHAASHRSAVEAYLNALTPAKVQEIQRRYGRRSLWMRPWLKGVTAGSDDHALLNVGRTWTQVELEAHEPPIDAAGFVKRVMAGRGVAMGQAGHSALLAHQLLSVTANHYAHRLSHRGSPEARAAGAAIARFAGIDIRPPSRVRLALSALARRFRPGKRRPALFEAFRAHLPAVLDRHPAVQTALIAGGQAPALAHHDEFAAFFDDLTASLAGAIATGLSSGVANGDTRRTLDHSLGAAALTLAQLPTVYAMFHQNKERHLVESVHRAATPAAPQHPLCVSLFTDTLGDVNGVCRFIQNVADRAQATGRDLQAITSTALPLETRPNVFNFAPVFHAKMPGYDTLDITLPPLLPILRHVEKHLPDVIHISTPGPVGLIGLIAARMLRVPVTGVYHTDFPAYIDRLFDDFTFTSACEWYMRWFYSGFKSVLTRSAEYTASLTRLGLDPARVKPLMPGFEAARFNPRFRDETIWSRLEAQCGASARGLSRPGFKVLYVGRVSVEKNIPLLIEVWKGVAKAARRTALPVDLLIVGDGPDRAKAEKDLRGTHAHFLGFRHAEELSAIYASSDLFVFPSVTDTLGQVVMEAQASGLPVLVTDRGGPKEVVRHNATGHVLSPDDPEAWSRLILEYAEHPQRAREVGLAAAESMLAYDMAHSFEHFWNEHERVARGEAQPAATKSRTRPARDPVAPDAPLFDAPPFDAPPFDAPRPAR